MPGDDFDSLEISSTQFGSDLDLSEFMELMKDPGIKLDVIRDLAEKVEQGVVVDTDKNHSRILIRENLEVFQSTMQFAESFGIYLISKADSDRSYVDCLLEVTPGVLKREVFEVLCGSELEDESVLEEGRTLAESIAWLFGYDRLDRMALREPPVPTQEPYHHLKQPSIEAIQQWLADIARYYTLFEDLYNAVKHGGRVLPKPYTELVIDQESESLEVEIENYASFLCRRSESSKRYLAILPVHWLRDYSLQIAETVGRLFTHLRDSSEARKDQPDAFDLSFYSLEPSNEKSPGSWVWVQNPDHVMVLPRDDALTDLIPEEPAKGKRAVRATHPGDGLHLETVGDRNPSTDFPLVMTLEEQPSGNLYPEKNLRLNLQVSWSKTDVCQLVHLARGVETFQEGGDLRIEDLAEGRTIRMEGFDPESFSFPNLPFGRQRLELLCKLQTISGVKIPFPTFPTAKQVEYIDKLSEDGTSHLNRDEVRKRVEELGNLSKGSFTTVSICVVEVDGTEVHSEAVGQVPNTLQLEDPEFETEEGQERFEDVWGEPGTRLQTVIHPEDSDIPEVLDEIRENPMNGMEILEATDFGEADEKLNLGIGVKYIWEGDSFWGTECLLEFVVTPTQAADHSES